MIVCIAEKPSVAREIASILGAKTKKNGYFEGNGYAVTYTFGHLCTLKEPADYKAHWKSWDLNNLPMLPEKFDVKVVSNEGIQKQFSIVKHLFSNASTIINCGDAGQEGELIQRWVIQEAGYTGEIKRLWISSLTAEAIQDGFKNLKPSKNYDNLFYAGYSRAIGDWLLGLNATRLYTVKYGANKQVLSVGRVQTPTLAMVVNRYLEIQHFKPVPYWELQTTYRETVFSYLEGRFFNKETGFSLAEKVKTEDFEIIGSTRKKGKEYAPKLFDLTGLQVYSNTKFNLSADDTLKIAQKLYERKLVTYPRVDTTFLPNDVYPKVAGILSKLTNYSALISPILKSKIPKSSRVFNDKKVTDHHAIIPTGIQEPMGVNEQKVYDIICRRFIAVFYPDCQVANTNVQGKAAGVTFKTTGKEILEKGWRVVFENPNTKEKKESGILPNFTKGEKGPHQPSFSEKHTKPPKYFTEATLLRAMETAGKQVEDEEMRDLMKENGIGRPSTRANIIETLFKRKYINRNKKQILPTNAGLALIKVIKNKLLTSAELTGRWEKQLKEIEKGTVHPATFIQQMKQMVDHLVYEVRSNTVSSRISYEKKDTSPKKQVIKPKTGIEGNSCPKCKSGTLVKGKKAYGCSKYNTGCTFLIPFVFMDKKISDTQWKKLLKTGKTATLKGFKKNNTKINGYLAFSKLQTIEFIADKIDPSTCPKCKKGTLLKGKTAFGCSRYAENCSFTYSYTTIKEKLQGREFSIQNCYKIIHGD